MNQYKKHLIKEWFKKRKVILIGSGVFLVGGLIAFFVGMAMAGTNIIEMLTQPYAVTCYIIVAVALCILGVMLYFDFIKKKTGE